MGTVGAELLEKIENRTFILGIVGLGYVGLPLGITFASKGIKSLGFDLDNKKVNSLNDGKSYIKHIPSEKLAYLAKDKTFQATSDFDRLSEPDAILICVPTPLSKNREPDLSYIEATAKQISKRLRPGQIIVLESTTYPGTTVEVVQPILEESGLKTGEDFFLAFSPEREDPGNPHFGTSNIPKVVGGADVFSTDAATKIYQAALEKVVPVSSTQIAELTKLLENIFRSVNIAMVNELKVLCHRMNIDIWEAIRAASTKPFGYMPFYPGPGLGGHCIPIDPFYLTSKAREYDFQTKFIELAGEINTSMPYYVVQRVMEALNSQGKALNGAKLLVLGMAYKKDIDDDRESPSYKLVDILMKNGADVSYNDPFIPELKPVRKYSFAMKSQELTSQNIAEFDCVLMATDHSEYDLKLIYDNAQLVVDTRNAFREIEDSAGKLWSA